MPLPPPTATKFERLHAIDGVDIPLINEQIGMRME